MKNNKGSVSLVVLGLAFVAVLIGGYFMVGKNLNPTIQNISPTLTLPTAETVAPNNNNSQTEDDKNPVIYSVTPTSGPVGTKITIKGKNLNGFEGDLNARIATEFNTADYSSGIMYGERTGSTDTIVTVIKSPLCKKDNSYSGLPCEEYFYVTPGVYNISVKPWGKESNSVSFTVTK